MTLWTSRKGSRGEVVLWAFGMPAAPPALPPCPEESTLAVASGGHLLHAASMLHHCAPGHAAACPHPACVHTSCSRQWEVRLWPHLCPCVLVSVFFSFFL